MIQFVADRNEAGQRLDRLLRKKYPELPLSRIYGLLRKRDVKVNGTRADGELHVKEGDAISVYSNAEDEALMGRVTTGMPVARRPSEALVRAAIKPIAETEEWIVLDKPAGVAVHPGSNQRDGATLIELLWRQQGWEEGSTAFKPALVHRLDAGTSGVILAAKSAPALRRFTAALRERESRKLYLALVVGNPEGTSGEIRLRLERVDSRDGAKNLVSDE